MALCYGGITACASGGGDSVACENLLPGIFLCDHVRMESSSNLFADARLILARAVCVGGDIDTRSLRRKHSLLSAPLTLEAGRHGCAMVFRYGAVVFFHVEPEGESAFFNELKPTITRPTTDVLVEEVALVRSGEEKEGMEMNALIVQDFSLPVLQVIAEVLARSVVLERFEGRVGATFEALQPVASDFGSGHVARRSHYRSLLRRLGEVLLDQQEMVGRVAISDKPDVLWDRPDLERLHTRLTEEFEILDRFEVVEMKLNLIGRTIQTAIDLMQARRSLRVEWYIVILIVVEICLTLYEMFIRNR